MFKITGLSLFGLMVSLTTLGSLLLPWWSIRSPGVSIDVYPFGVMAWNVPVYDADWVVTRLVTLDSTLLITGLLVVASSLIAAIGSLRRLRLFLAAPLVVNLSSAYLFYRLMRDALGELAFGSFSGTNLVPIPGAPWGFSLGIGVCVLAGVTSGILLLLSCLRFME